MSIGYFSDEFCNDLKKFSKVNKAGSGYFNRIRKRIQASAVHFQLPQGGYILPKDGDVIDFDTDILRPPFPTTIIEYSEGGGDLRFDETPSTKRLVLAVDENDGVTLFPAYYSDVNDIWQPPILYWRFMYGRNFSLSRTIPKDFSNSDAIRYGEGWFGALASGKIPMTLDQFAAMEIRNINQELSVYMDFCMALSQYETDIIDQKPDDQAQKLRRLRGKKPLYTYKVITITGKRKPPKEAKGGTHASPVTHLRRGHWRHYKSGKRCWVEATMINGKDGMVVKDYKVEARYDQ